MIVCLFKHKWVYKSELLGKQGYGIFKSNTRICKRCLKKQSGLAGLGSYNFNLKEYYSWTDIELDKDEKRHLLLKKMGI